ncbi:hypothetical protein WME97_48525 [Sorangium sp. So ce367]|uniref:lipase family protein n=1 Tax=Sorangium sp. So ce367 TaxID=3133305 RepID=UPI003F61A4E6
MSFYPSRDQQARYAIAMIANLGQRYAGSSAVQNTLGDIKGALRSMQDKIGTWSVVWGPALYFSDPSGNPDNIMYVAQQEGTNNYVIGIAGTNFANAFDFVYEDLGVTGTTPWMLLGAPAGAAISDGTYLGLANLLNTPASAGTPQAGVKIMDFLAAESKKGALNLAVAGHSLGGALAPTLALYIKNVSLLWDASRKSTVLTMPVAGPTPGNKVFADYLNTTVTVDGFYNDRDVVPHVWSASDLSELATIYGETDLIGGFIAGIAAGIATLATKDFNYTPTERTELKGSVLLGKLYFDQAGFQHLYAYDLFFFDNQIQPALHPPSTESQSVQIPSTLADAVKNAGGTIPSYIEVVPPRPQKEVTVGKKTFKVPASADAEQIRQAVMATAPHFGDALGL